MDICKGVKASNVVPVVCACFNFACPLTLVFALSTLLHDWMSSFGTTRGQTAAVQATCIGLMFGTGVMAGILERKLGPRMSMMAGGCVASLGLFGGGFARSFPVLVASVGIVAGFGFSLLHLSSLSTGLRRFPKKAAFISSLMASAASVFHLGTPYLYRFLSETYTWRGCLIIASGVSLQTLIFTLILTSPVLCKEPSSKQYLESTFKVAVKVQGQAHKSITTTTAAQGDLDVSADMEAMQLIVTKEAVARKRSDIDPLVHAATGSVKRTRGCMHEGVEETGGKKAAERCERAGEKVEQTSHWAFLKNPLYILVSIITMISLSTVLGILVLIVDFSISNGWSVQDGVFFFFLFQLAGLIGRITIGLVSLHKLVHCIPLLAGSAVTGAVALGMLGQIVQYELTAFLFSLMGVGYGGVVSMFPPAIFSVTGAASYPLALGLACSLEGVLDGISGIATGFLVDALGSYRVPCLVYGVVSLCFGLLLILGFKCSRRTLY